MKLLDSAKRKTFTVKEIAVRYSVSVSTVYRWIASGKLKSILIGRCRRVLLEQEEEFLNSHI